MLIITQGDLFKSNAVTLVNAVNCVGVMGKGIAAEFKRRYPAMFFEYRALCKQGMVRPNTPHFYRDSSGISILNMPTKVQWQHPSCYAYVEDGLKWFREHYRELSIRSAAFPALGCGLGGLGWQQVLALMERYLGDIDIDVEVYQPNA